MALVPFSEAEVEAPCRLGKFSVTLHAQQRLSQRRILLVDLIPAMGNFCEIVEHQPHIAPGPRAVVLTRLPGGRSIHAVCCLDDKGTLEIVTAYEPAPPYWSNERTRLKRGDPP